jgi:D-glycero-alpha-D-manno-heptose-7-phosphate kinase
LRLGLAGGGTDLLPYRDNFGGSVVNVTINKYNYIILKVQKRSEIKFINLNNKKRSIIKIRNKPLSLNGNFILHKGVYNYMIKNFNNNKFIPVKIESYSEVKYGSGLGSSSSMTVALIKAFSELFNLNLKKKRIAQLAYHIERIECGIKGGIQDQYAVTYGGFNYIEFSKNNKTNILNLKINKKIYSKLESSILICHSGISRNSSLIINDQIKNLSLNKTKVLESTHFIKKESKKVRKFLLKGNLNGFIDSINNIWENKKNLNKKITNKLINKILSISINSGALAGKISGAGGGGYIWLYVPVDKRSHLTNNLSSFVNDIENIKFENSGVTSWTVNEN